MEIEARPTSMAATRARDRAELPIDRERVELELIALVAELV